MRPGPYFELPVRRGRKFTSTSADPRALLGRDRGDEAMHFAIEHAADARDRAGRPSACSRSRAAAPRSSTRSARLAATDGSRRRQAAPPPIAPCAIRSPGRSPRRAWPAGAGCRPDRSRRRRRSRPRCRRAPRAVRRPARRSVRSCARAGSRARAGRRVLIARSTSALPSVAAVVDEQHLVRRRPAAPSTRASSSCSGREIVPLIVERNNYREFHRV